MTPSLDLSLLRAFVPPGVFMRIDPRVESRLAPFPELLDRVLGCVEFCYLLHVGRVVSIDQTATPPSADELLRRRCFLRGALAEYASMDDAAQLDFASIGGGSSPRMKESTDPRVHAVRLLRHANVHVSSTALGHAAREAVWLGPDGAIEFTYTMIIANDLDSSIRATRDSRHYAPADLDTMIRWLETEQREWGINHVVLRCAELYATAVADACQALTRP